MATASHPASPIDPTDCLHDQRHFVTPAGGYSAEELSSFVAVEPVTDLTNRYRGDVRFSPSDVGVDLWQTPDDRVVLDAIVELRGNEIDARPVYGFGFEGHWSLEPGGEAAHRQPLDGLPIPLWSKPTHESPLQAESLKGGAPGSRRVAVVDSGFADVLPPSMGNSSEISEPDAMEVHGTLVSWLVELVAPDAAIRYVSVPLTDGFGFKTQPHWFRSGSVATGAIQCTDDLVIANAVRLLAKTGGADCLNLSLGTYLAAMSLGDRQAEPVMSGPMERALDTAKKHGLKVIAAAGNDDRGAEGPLFYPACRDEVIAVGAANLAGESQLWDHGTRVNDKRPWWDYQAPGIDLCGAPFDPAGGALRWSGSSFAAPLVTGLYARGDDIDPSVGSTVVQVSYQNIPGLMYLGVGSTVVKI